MMVNLLKGDPDLVVSFDVTTFLCSRKTRDALRIISWFNSVLLSLLIYTFATLASCEGRKEAEHAGDAHWIRLRVDARLARGFVECE